MAAKTPVSEIREGSRVCASLGGPLCTVLAVTSAKTGRKSGGGPRAHLLLIDEHMKRHDLCVAAGDGVWTPAPELREILLTGVDAEGYATALMEESAMTWNFRNPCFS